MGKLGNWYYSRRPTLPAYVRCSSPSVCLFACPQHNSTRRMAIANGTCVSFCEAHFGLPWVYAPGTISVNVKWMKRGFNACHMHYASQYVPIYLQPFPSKFAILAHFLHILAYPVYAPGTIAVNVTWMERGFNSGQKHSSIYPSIFNHLRAIFIYL